MTRRGEANGFFKLILAIIIIVIVLAYFGIDLRDLINNWWPRVDVWLESLLGLDKLTRIC